MKDLNTPALDCKSIQCVLRHMAEGVERFTFPFFDEEIAPPLDAASRELGYVLGFPADKKMRVYAEKEPKLKAPSGKTETSGGGGRL